MIFHCELPEAKRAGGLEQAVYDITKTLNNHTGMTHARIGDHYPQNLKGVQAVHFHGLWYPPHINLAKECISLKIPYIVSPHGMLEPWALKHKGLKKWIHRVLFTNTFLRKAQSILTTSKIEAEHVQALFPKQEITSIPLGIRDLPSITYTEARSKLGIDCNTIHLLYLSRIDIKKNLLELLEALPKVIQNVQKNIALSIIGEGSGPYMSQCLQAAQSCRLAGIKISFKGPVWDDSKWSWLAASDLFCLPSSSENFGYVYMESLATGTPILTTKHTPWGHFDEQPFVHICEPKIDSIATRIQNAIKSPATDTVRSAARSFIEKEYTWSSLAPRYEKLYPSADHE